ncbi:hypothetical protein [Gordonia terrae]|uniref:hypothetical protein n=1 Tax=Gordonia terrae TaxID=2055 RepID=UPI003F6C42F2
MSAPAMVPINRAEGDFPSDRPTTFTDGYNRSQVLVPIEQLQEAEARAQRASAVADRLAADCDRLTAERDAALAERVNLTGWLLTEIGDGNDAGATLIDLVRRYAEEECAVANALRDSWQRDADDAAILIERIKAGDLAWDGSAWVEPVVNAKVIDHTDPDQIRCAAGVIEGIAMDAGSPRPHATMVNAAGLRHRAEQIEARS